MQHRRYKESLSKHIFVIHVPHLLVLWEIHDERTHERRLAMTHIPRRRVNVGQKGITQAYHLLNGIIHRFAFLAELINLAWGVSTVGTHHRCKSSEL